jgi:radical SAM protein (TIGR01212 family)
MEKQKQIYRRYSEYLKEKYGTKVYKLPVNLPVTCPNRDGTIGWGGCSFCGEEGAGFENLSNALTVKEQLQRNMAYIRKRYKAQKFIAYFQNFTNTYMPLETFKEAVHQAVMEDIVQISVSTRPDCVRDEYLVFLQQIQQRYNMDIVIELGLQTANYHTLKEINRGHSLAEFLDAVIRIKKYGFEICTHLILNLPWDNQYDVVENAKILSALNIEQVKLHSLYIVENTILGKQYQEKQFEMISLEEYKQRVIIFLEYLSPDVVVQRLIGRAPEENTLFVNWNTSWWKIRDEIEREMTENKIYQGQKVDYLNGKAVKQFFK